MRKLYVFREFKLKSVLIYLYRLKSPWKNGSDIKNNFAPLCHVKPSEYGWYYRYFDVLLLN